MVWYGQSQKCLEYLQVHMVMGSRIMRRDATCRLSNNFQLLPQSFFQPMQTTIKRLATPVWSTAAPWLSSTANNFTTATTTTTPPSAPALRPVALPTAAASFAHFTTANQVGLPGGFSVMNPNLKDLEGDDYLYHLGLNPAE